MVWTLVAAASLAGACAILSVLVVLRRWSFFGEGIAHAGFGGVGTAWFASLFLGEMATPLVTYSISVGFCLVAGLCIAMLTRRQKLEADTAIGIFLAASLAWGFLAKAIFQHVQGYPPPNFEAYLLGDLGDVSMEYALAAVGAAALAVLVVSMMFKEIVFYAFDPDLARTTGLRVGFIHYLLAMLLTLMIVVAMRLMGQLLVTALVVIPGATALQLSRKMGNAILISVGAALIAAVAGPLIHANWSFVPSGPMISLIMLLEFVLASAAAAVLNRGGRS